MIAALGLLPENDVHLGLENLKEFTDEITQRTIPLLDYDERVNVGSEGGRHSDPLKLHVALKEFGKSMLPAFCKWKTVFVGLSFKRLRQLH